MWATTCAVSLGVVAIVAVGCKGVDPCVDHPIDGQAAVDGEVSGAMTVDGDVEPLQQGKGTYCATNVPQGTLFGGVGEAGHGDFWLYVGVQPHARRDVLLARPRRRRA